MDRFILILLLFHSVLVEAQQARTITSTRKEISFLSGGIELKGWLYLPHAETKAPYSAVVMAPGFSGTTECNYQFIADHFCRAGLAVLLFDYPNFGASGGNIRSEADPWQQVQAYCDGISFLCTRPEVDTSRIGVWGGSYSGGHALAVSALDSRVKCLVAMTPFASGSDFKKALPPDNASYLYGLFNADRTARMQGGKPAMIPVASRNADEFCAIPSPHAMEFIESFASYAATYVNAVTLRSLEMQLEYNPGVYAADIPGIPKLFLIAKQDELIPEDQIKQVFQQASEPKELLYIEGNHFTPYMDGLETVSDMMAKWMMDHLR